MSSDSDTIDVRGRLPVLLDQNSSVRLLDGNTEAAFSAELVTAVSTEIGMGFGPISIYWHAMNSDLIPGVALRAVLFKGAENFVWIVAHCCSPSF